MNIDLDMLKQLSLSSDLNGSDGEILRRVLAGVTSGNKVKMTPQERNRLISKLSNQNSNEYVPTKDFSQMNEEEKLVHREALKKRLRDKQKAAEQARTGKSVGGGKSTKSVNNAMSGLNELLSKLDMSQINAHAEQIAKNTVENNIKNNSNETKLEEPIVKQEDNLDDYVN